MKAHHDNFIPLPATGSGLCNPTLANETKKDGWQSFLGKDFLALKKRPNAGLSRVCHLTRVHERSHVATTMDRDNIGRTGLGPGRHHCAIELMKPVTPARALTVTGAVTLIAKVTFNGIFCYLYLNEP